MDKDERKKLRKLITIKRINMKRRIGNMKNIGAVIGDIVGSRFEFHNIKTKEFDLFSSESRPTDDSVLTIACMDWLINGDRSSDESAVKFLRKWSRRYPNAGFGGMFYKWMRASDPKPYNSCGNGSAMRISPVGWLCDSEEEVIRVSNIFTRTTHNHIEGLKGAETVAMMVFKARMGASKEELKKYSIEKYPEIERLDYEDLRKNYFHGQEICQVTVPQALYCFLISNSFEDCLRTTISIGGDCDTTAAISCAIAEAYYGNISDDIIAGLKKKLPLDMLGLLYKVNDYMNNKENKNNG